MTSLTNFSSGPVAVSVDGVGMTVPVGSTLYEQSITYGGQVYSSHMLTVGDTAYVVRDVPSFWDGFALSVTASMPFLCLALVVRIIKRLKSQPVEL